MKGEVTKSMNQGSASGQEETVVGETGKDAPAVRGNLMESVVEKENLIAALRKVERNCQMFCEELSRARGAIDCAYCWQF